MNNAETLFDEKLLCKQFRNIAAADNVFETFVNNHLKTTIEIDAEFALQINIDRAMLQESSDELDAYKSILKNGGQTVSPTSLYHGFMEENY